MALPSSSDNKGAKGAWCRLRARTARMEYARTTSSMRLAIWRGFTPVPCAMRSLDRYARAKLNQLTAQGLRRTLVETARAGFPNVVRNGRGLVSFSCNDYLGLSQHAAVKAAAAAALETHGTGAGASRLVTGNHPLYAELEAALAAAKGAEAACIFGSGYLANIGVIGALAGDQDLIVIDELAHACLNAGAQLSRASVKRYRHNDVDHAAKVFAERRADHRHAMLVTETVFSMDGDRAPLAALADLAETFDAWLLSDDAHGLGLTMHRDGPVPLQVGTLSKALGSYGGYLCASASVIDLIKTRARSLVYSTALPPASVAAALAALRITAAQPHLVALPLAKARRFTSSLGLEPAQSAIVPLVLGAPDRAMAAAEALAESGFLVTAIRPPTVPAGTARLRFAFTALHADADIDRLAAAVRNLERVPCLASS